jgi:N6-adenosine-specific RNA methylase IME4
METPEICKIPVPATPDAVLFLWVPGSCLPEAFEVLEAWGFEYVTNIVWIKNVVGLGNWVRNQHELLLIGRRGQYARTIASQSTPFDYSSAPEGTLSKAG